MVNSVYLLTALHHNHHGLITASHTPQPWAATQHNPTAAVKRDTQEEKEKKLNSARSQVTARRPSTESPPTTPDCLGQHDRDMGGGWTGDWLPASAGITPIHTDHRTKACKACQGPSPSPTPSPANGARQKPTDAASHVYAISVQSRRRDGDAPLFEEIFLARLCHRVCQDCISTYGAHAAAQTANALASIDADGAILLDYVDQKTLLCILCPGRRSPF